MIQWEYMADSAEPDVKSGSAEFVVGGELARVHLEKFLDGVKLHALMHEAYRLGREASNVEIGNMLREAAEKLHPQAKPGEKHES
jgi:hypothetical protein